MELKQLEYFLAVSKLKSFTLAADQLYISQPGITAAIRRLEDELGVTLFVKKRKSAVLTPEGEVFATHVQHVITDMHGALQELDKLKNLHQGRIRIGITPISGISSPAYLLAKFKVMYPELQLELVEGSSLQLEQQLEQDALDMAFLVGVPLEPSLQLTIYACYRQAHNMSQATETFLAFVRSACEI